jgi:hypothetical protein
MQGYQDRAAAPKILETFLGTRTDPLGSSGAIIDSWRLAADGSHVQTRKLSCSSSCLARQPCVILRLKQCRR